MDREPLEPRSAFRNLSSRFWGAPRLQGTSMGWRKPGIELPSVCLRRRLYRQQCSAVEKWLPPHPNLLPWGEGIACEGSRFGDASAADVEHGTSNHRRTVLALP